MGRHSRASSCSSRSSVESDYEHCDYSGVYQYFKQHLLMDKSLMVAGSDAYINTFSQLSESIPVSHSVHMEGTTTAYNIDHFYASSPYYVREDGVYILFFISTDNESSQFTIFINGAMEPLTTIGNNSGAGQLISRHMLELKKDDNIVVRNYLSDSGSITQSELVGGFNPISDTTFLIMKIAPLREAVCERMSEEPPCIRKKEKTLFKKVLGDMVYDKELMLKGFNTHGTFASKSTQLVAVEAPVLYDISQNVNNLELAPLAGDVKILEDGIYKVFFLVTTGTACQFGIFVNGLPVNATIAGTNKGAGQLTLRVLLPLNKGDALSVRNHTSAGAVQITGNAGGNVASNNVILTIFKIAPLVKAVVNCAPKEVHGCRLNYKAFRHYLLMKKWLQIDGAQAYASACISPHQDLFIGSPIYFQSKQVENLRIEHRQGSTTFKVERDGIYDVFADVITNQPAQFTIFINNIPDLTTTFGRDSGGNRTLVRQFMKLQCGDVLTIRNYESALGKVVTSSNPGGNFVGQNALFMLFRLSPIDCAVHKLK
jgi:hypothetical protein